jgi:hypothetical protein
VHDVGALMSQRCHSTTRGLEACIIKVQVAIRHHDTCTGVDIACASLLRVSVCVTYCSAHSTIESSGT